ncbi:MAG: MaoC family dehydratase [Phycisphaerae bacterium]|nr:MaoC family dehydratase [Gemmatimonadaceae bacterium]
MASPQTFYLEDFAVGQTFTSVETVVTEAEIIAFGTRYDPQPFHTDPEAAKSSIFHGLAASGWHTAAMTMRMFVDSDLKPAGGLLGAGVEALDWPRPVRPGDTLHVEVEVVSVRESQTKPTQGMVVVQANTKNQHGETVQSFRPKLVVPKRPAGATS